MSVWTELPGVYLDAIGTSTDVGIYVVNTIPEEDSIDAPVDTHITVELFSTHTEAVAESKTDIYVEGNLAFEGGGTPKFKPGYDGGASASTVLNGHDLRVVIDLTTDFESEDVVTVRIISSTSGDTYTVDDGYTFTCEDTIKPQVVAAKAITPTEIRVTFNEGMRALDATGTNDALNPANYAFQFIPETDRQAGVSINAVSVSQYSATQFDVTVDIVPTFWKTYRVTCGDIADSSTNANLLDANYRTADFSSWYPPNWPARRSFDLWQRLSDDDREGDIYGDGERLISAQQDVVDILLWDSDTIEDWWDIDRASESYIDAMLAEMGNPFKFDLDVDRKRKLLAVLPDIYKQKGTAAGLINVVRFFLGIEITEITEYNKVGWELGYSKLGIDTILGPSDDRALYTFVINVDRVLTDEERLQLTAIARYMKPAHTHFQIVEPGDPEHIDHWKLGLSQLGINTILHEGA